MFKFIVLCYFFIVYADEFMYNKQLNLYLIYASSDLLIFSNFDIKIGYKP